METIQTERLILRPYADSDADRVLDIFSRMDVIKWLGNPPYVPMETRDEALLCIARWHGYHDEDPHSCRYAIEVRESGVVAGTVLVARMERIDGGFIGEYEIGWHLHPDSEGHGYATEAAAALLTFSFGKGLEELWCGMFVHNVASAAVARRLGLPEYDLHELGWDEDPWYGGESRLFKATRDEWIGRDRGRPTDGPAVSTRPPPNP